MLLYRSGGFVFAVASSRPHRCALQAWTKHSLITQWMGWDVGPLTTGTASAGCVGEMAVLGALRCRRSNISAKRLSSKFLFPSYSVFLLSFLSRYAPFSQCTYQRETNCPGVTGHWPLRISDPCTDSLLIDLHLIWPLKPIEEAPRAGQPGTSQSSAVCCSLL